MASRFCPKCGQSNLTGSAFCTNCGNPLTASAVQQPQQQTGTVPVYTPPPAPLSGQYYGYTQSYFEQHRLQGIDRTKTGLLLLVIGYFISWVPIVGALGGLLEFIGAIFVILGRHAFDYPHPRNVMWSIIIFVVGIVAVIVAALVIVFSALASSIPFNSTSSNAFAQNFTSSFSSGFELVIVVGSAIFGLAEVLFTYALQNKTGRMLLWIAYVTALVAGTVNFLFLYGSLLSLPSVVPAVLFGYAYYLARERINRGEVPSRSAQAQTGPTGYTPPPQNS